jgi:hypothetical protein
MVSYEQLARRGYSDGDLLGRWNFVLDSLHKSNNVVAILHDLWRCHDKDIKVN